VSASDDHGLAPTSLSSLLNLDETMEMSSASVAAGPALRAARASVVPTACALHPVRDGRRAVVALERSLALCRAVVTPSGACWRGRA
jgi:hypothetical protein